MLNNNMKIKLVCWHTPVIPALRRLRQEDGDFAMSPKTKDL
jgi:hypothetical protein